MNPYVIYNYILLQKNNINLDVSSLEKNFYLLEKNDENNARISYYCCLLAWDIFKSEYITYKHFTNINFEYLTSDEKKQIFTILYHIFSDPFLVKKALGINLSRNAHQITLKKIKTNLLIDGIFHMSDNSSFQSYFQNILSSQPEETWNESLFILLKEEIEKLPSHTITNSSLTPFGSSINKNNFSTLLQSNPFESILNFLYEAICKEFTPSDNDFQNMLSILAACNHYEGLCWTFFYKSIFDVRKNPQSAKESVLTSFTYLNKIEDPISQKKIKILNLLSWSNICYRNGKTSESLLFLISSFREALKINFYYPFIEIASLIIIKYNLELHSEKSLSFLDTYNKFYKNLKFIDLKEYLYYKDPSKRITELEKIIFSNKMDINYAAEIFNLFQCYINTGKKEKATILIKEHLPILLESIDLRLDVAPNILRNLIISIPAGEITLTYSLVSRLLRTLEKIRDSHNFSFEKAYFFDRNIENYKLCVLTLVHYYNAKYDLNKSEILSLLEISFSAFSLRSFYEQKNNNFIIDPYILSLQNKYFELQQKILQNEISDSISTARRLDKIKNILTNTDPLFKDIQKFKYLSLEDIQKKLNENEIFYQYIAHHNFITWIIILKDNIKISLFPFEDYEIFEMNSYFGISIQNFEEIIKSSRNEFDNFMVFTCSLIFAPLIHELKNNFSLKDIYIVQDFQLNYFTKNLLLNYPEIPQERINSIQYLPNLEVSTKRKFNKTNLKVLILDDTKDLDIFKNTAKSIIPSPEIFEYDTLIIIAHGIPFIDFNNKGAILLKGKEKNYRLSELINHKKIENLILLSCGSGLGLNNQIETNNGTLGDCISANISNAVLCRWDVPIVSANKFLEYFINEHDNESSFNQKINSIKCKLSLEFDHFAYWGAFDLWSF